MNREIKGMVICAVLILLISGGGAVFNVGIHGKGNDLSHNEIPADGFGDSATGIVVSIGMSKETIESLFEDWEVTYGNYTIYMYNGVEITYDENDDVDYVAVLHSDTYTWETNLGLKVGDSLDDAAKIHGKYRRNEEAPEFVRFYEGDMVLYVQVDDKGKLKSMFY